MSTSAWLSEPLLRAAADPMVFARGRDYAADRRVDLVEVADAHISATVHGTFVWTWSGWPMRSAMPRATFGDYLREAAAFLNALRRE